MNTLKKGGMLAAALATALGSMAATKVITDNAAWHGYMNRTAPEYYEPLAATIDEDRYAESGTIDMDNDPICVKYNTWTFWEKGYKLAVKEGDKVRIDFINETTSGEAGGDMSYTVKLYWELSGKLNSLKQNETYEGHLEYTAEKDEYIYVFYAIQSGRTESMTGKEYSIKITKNIDPETETEAEDNAVKCVKMDEDDNVKVYDLTGNEIFGGRYGDFGGKGVFVVKSAAGVAKIAR